MIESLTKKYRPRRFSDVVGQPEAVELISGLVRQGVGRNLLLHGSIGSGKTALVEIYAKGLNCLHREADGSPCNHCENCRFPGEFYCEYDVPGSGGDVETVSLWLDGRYRTPQPGLVRVIFFDEAQELTPKAQSALLKRAEFPTERVFFCFATTEPAKILPALASRFWPIRIGSIGTDDAVALLENIAKKENIIFEREALYLLAAAKAGQPRDLVMGLEQLAATEPNLTTSLVERVFGLQFRYLIYQYCVALADGDARKQGETMALWREDLSTKIAWVRRFLLETLHCNVLGRSTGIDPLIHTLNVERMDVVQRFCRRFQVAEPAALAPQFDAMLGFWSRQSASEQVDLQLTLGLFESLVNRQLSHMEVKPAASWPLSTVRQAERRPINDGQTVTLPPVEQSNNIYLESQDVVTLINRISAFVQNYGRLMNASLAIFPAPDEWRSEDRAIRAIRRFEQAFSDRFDEPESAFANVTLFERDGRVVGKSVAHIPAGRDQGEANAAVMSWCRQWEDSTGDTISLDFADSGADPKFHWGVITALCVGAENDEGNSASSDVRVSLGIPKGKWKSFGPISCSPLSYSWRLSAESLNAACVFGLAFKKALDPISPRRLDESGWELGEHQLRAAEIENRRIRERGIRSQFRDNPARMNSELEDLYRIWQAESEIRVHRSGS